MLIENTDRDRSTRYEAKEMYERREKLTCNRILFM
jgi:hypothetical protein